MKARIQENLIILTAALMMLAMGFEIGMRYEHRKIIEMMEAELNKLTAERMKP